MKGLSRRFHVPTTFGGRDTNLPTPLRHPRVFPAFYAWIDDFRIYLNAYPHGNNILRKIAPFCDINLSIK